MSVNAQIRIGDNFKMQGKYDYLPSVGHFLAHAEKTEKPVYGIVRSVVWLGPGSGPYELEDDIETDYEVIIFADIVELVDGQRGIFRVHKTV